MWYSTLGDSGAVIDNYNFTIPAGATITNNGTANRFWSNRCCSWQTTIKTGDFTAANGEGYFIDTSGGAFTVNLPSGPSAGAVVSVLKIMQILLIQML